MWILTVFVMSIDGYIVSRSKVIEKGKIGLEKWVKNTPTKLQLEIFVPFRFDGPLKFANLCAPLSQTLE